MLLDDLLTSALKLCQDERLHPTPGRLHICNLTYARALLFMEWRSTVMTLSNRLFVNLFHVDDVVMNRWENRAVHCVFIF